MFFKLKKGLTLPIKGLPDERIDDAGSVSSVAVLGSDYVGLKPTMLVQIGDRVKNGTPLFEDKKNPGVIVVSPASGTVSAIHRGARRALLSVVIDIDEGGNSNGNSNGNGDDSVDFSILNDDGMLNFDEQQIISTLQKSGLWTSFKTRPYGKVPAVDSKPASLFVNAMDTNPLAINPEVVINVEADAFVTGINILTKLNVPLYLCQKKGAKLPEVNNQAVSVANFSGPHPAGLPSTHIHYIDPVNVNKTVWTIGYQDVIAIGKLFTDGKLDRDCYVALGGPLVNSPRILKTKRGANLSKLVENRVIDGERRVVSGSVLNGHLAEGEVDYLGRYDSQVVVLKEDAERKLFEWIVPGFNKFSALNVYVANFIKPRNYNITTSQNGSPRAIVPVGVFERVMPLDVLPTPLVKALLVKDTDSAQQLGCLELVEEDMALLSFVDPGKHDFGPVLRSTLNQIERDG